MAYVSWSVVFGEQPSASKWNILGTNDASFNDGTGIPIQSKSTVFTAVATGTTVMPIDDTIPQITEGDQYMTQAITPKSATSVLVITVNAQLATSVAGQIGGAIFQDATSNALAAGSVRSGGGEVNQLQMWHRMTSGTTSSTTFRFRAGPGTAATVTFNGSAGARLFGAITKSVMIVEEFAA